MDDCRIPTTEKIETHSKSSEAAKGNGIYGAYGGIGTHQTDGQKRGRFPANLLVENGVLGDYSRFFSLNAWAQTLPFVITPKASKGEKNAGLDHLENKVLARSGGAQQAVRKGDDTYLEKHIGLNRIMHVKNNHPTVKPLTLMSYLITLGSRPSDVVLDPFVGSGTTALAATMLDRRFIGIEREAEYVNIARARLKAARPSPPTFIAAE